MSQQMSRPKSETIVCKYCQSLNTRKFGWYNYPFKNWADITRQCVESTLLIQMLIRRKLPSVAITYFAYVTVRRGKLKPPFGTHSKTVEGKPSCRFESDLRHHLVGMNKTTTGG
jgi:hypothetical protein